MKPEYMSIWDFWLNFKDSIATYRNWKEATKESYHRILASFLEDSSFTLREATYSELERLCIEELTISGELPTPSYIRNRLVILHDIYIFAASKGYVADIFKFGGYKNFITKIMPLAKSSSTLLKKSETIADLVKNAHKGVINPNLRRSIPFQSAAQLTKHLCKNAPTGDGHLMSIALFFYCGLRPAECRGVTFSDLIPFSNDPNRHCIVINKIQKPDGTIVSYPKTAPSIRMIPVHIELEALLQQRIEYLKNSLPTGINIATYPIVCDGQNFAQHCQSNRLSYAVTKELKKFILFGC